MDAVLKILPRQLSAVYNIEKNARRLLPSGVINLFTKLVQFVPITLCIPCKRQNSQKQ